MANYAIMRIEKRHLGSVTAIGNHHERLKEKYKSNPDIDPERSQFNYHLVQPEKKYRQAVLDRIEGSGAKMRKNSVVLQDCFVGATPEWIREKSVEEQKEYFDHAYAFFEKKFGRENMISAVVHLDEATPHMHLCFVPITPDGHLSSKQIIGGPKGLEKLQDEFYEHMHERYPELARGLSKKITHRKHLPTQLYKNAEDLDRKYDEIVAAVNGIKGFNSGKKRDEAIRLLGQYAPEMAQMKAQLHSTEKYIKTLEKDRSFYESKFLGEAYDNSEQKKEILELKRTVNTLLARQKKLQHVIEQIPEDTLKQMAAEEKQRRKKERGR